MPTATIRSSILPIVQGDKCTNITLCIHIVIIAHILDFGVCALEACTLLSYITLTDKPGNANPLSQVQGLQAVLVQCFHILYAVGHPPVVHR